MTIYYETALLVYIFFVVETFLNIKVTLNMSPQGEYQKRVRW